MNSEEYQPDKLRAVVRATQIIIAALATGVAGFAAFVLFSGVQVGQGRGLLLTLISLPFGAVCAVTSLVLPRLIAANNRRGIAHGTWTPGRGVHEPPASDAGKLMVGFQTKTIVAGALLEGAAFFALTAHMMEGHWLSLAVAGILWLGLFAHFPTNDGIEAWLNDELRLLQGERPSR